MLCWHIHPNVIFMYNIVACRATAESPILLGGERYMCVCFRLCVCVCVSDVVSFHLYSFSLRAMAYIQPFISVLLCDCAMQNCAIKETTDSWQALTTFWTGLGSFYFQFKHFESVLEVTKFLSSATREEFKLKLKSPQPEVRCYRWHSLSRGQCM